MTTGVAFDKMVTITASIKEIEYKFEMLKEKFIGKIRMHLNKLINLIERYVNMPIQWLDMQIYKIKARISEIVKNLNAKINSILQGFQAWVDTQITRLKIKVAKAILAKVAKLGDKLNNIDEKEWEEIANTMIPISAPTISVNINLDFILDKIPTATLLFNQLKSQLPNEVISLRQISNEILNTVSSVLDMLDIF